MNPNKPPAGEHLPFLDYMRGFAILSVFCFHGVGATFGTTDHQAWVGLFRSFDYSRSFLALLPFTLGWAGVTLFFVISGFCIHLSHERSREKSLEVFFIRRFFRIYPPFLLALLIFSAARLDFHTQFWASLSNFAIHFFLLNNYLPGPGGINGAFWSIATEFQLYLLYPILLFIAARWGWRRTMWFTGSIWAAMEVTATLGIALYPGFDFPMGYYHSPFIAWYIWSIGAALADAYLKGEPLPFRKIPIYVWLVLGVTSYFYRPIYMLTSACLAMASVSIIALCLERRELTWMSRIPPIFKPLSTLGLVSYSAYLLHQPMMKMTLLVVQKVLHNPHLPSLVVYAMAMSTMVVIFPISYAFYRFIELPSIDLGKWVIQKRREAKVAPAARPDPQSV